MEFRDQDDEHVTEESATGDDAWQPRDAWLGVLFVFVGALIVTYAWLAMRKGTPSIFWVSGWLAGPILLLLGINSIVRSIAAFWR